MAVVINTNYSATVASSNPASSNASLQRSLNRLSSDSRIDSLSDDAGGLGVLMLLSVIPTVSDNMGHVMSHLQTQEGVFQVPAKILDRVSPRDLPGSPDAISWYNRA
jgi:flagellin